MHWQLHLESNNPTVIKWLKETQKLSEALRSVLANWQISLLSQKNKPINAIHQNLLKTDEKNAWVRTIAHYNDQTPLILGRVVIAKHVFDIYEDQLLSLKSRSIGDKLLFCDPHLKRSDFLYAQFNTQDDYLNDYPRELLKPTDIKKESQNIIARSSVFKLKGVDSVLVEEFFLDNFFELIKNKSEII